MNVLTLELPETLYQQLEFQANSEGVSLTQHVLSALHRQASFHYRKEALPPHPATGTESRQSKIPLPADITRGAHRLLRTYRPIRKNHFRTNSQRGG